jgi:hypothetical protein
MCRYPNSFLISNRITHVRCVRFRLHKGKLIFCKPSSFFLKQWDFAHLKPWNNLSYFSMFNHVKYFFIHDILLWPQCLLQFHSRDFTFRCSKKLMLQINKHVNFVASRFSTLVITESFWKTLYVLDDEPWIISQFLN